MARGWESKGIEAQQDEARRGPAGPATGPVSAAERARIDRRQGLALARARAAADLAYARTPAQRDMLERALADLDRMLDDPGLA
jgi:hypothetical protein